MFNHCAVTADLGRYLDQQERYEVREEAVVSRAIETMLPGGEYDPLDAGNLAEAISEVGAALGSTFWSKFAALMDANDAIALLVHIRAASNAYWLRMAEDDAEKQLADEARDQCRCHGRGCRRCEEQD